ncbi:hypothetical protein [Phenylobacterium sp. 58.2.17]|uniref:hypothetical protein n=1 Tax=Phenylobacterium sp. 58.2.17 TaxID=2969306 RepID=UPI0022652193|nr:hypothetical protein [Phenylobacterium sp. 58.2.17]MCX7586558.1 hypothetical protein [Phenylobacterium sp. 58.2.17]
MTLFFLLLDWLLFAVLVVIAIALTRDVAKDAEARRPIDKVEVAAAALLLLAACRLVAP